MNASASSNNKNVEWIVKYTVNYLLYKVQERIENTKGVAKKKAKIGRSTNRRKQHLTKFEAKIIRDCRSGASHNMTLSKHDMESNCVKSVHIRSFSGPYTPYLSVFSPNKGK